jgi:putative Mg2+ transporter-C (MgtC) family protein
MIGWLSSFGIQLDFIPHLMTLLFAYVLALPIGWDRERNERSAGLRTFPLVAIAACGFIQAAETITAGSPEATARIVEGLINGVGFIGGGAILVGKGGTRGTATAASLWATGAVGAAVGLGAYDIAIVLSFMTFATLRIMTNFKSSDVQDEQIAEGLPEEPPTAMKKLRRK